MALTSACAVMTFAAPAQAATYVLYNEYTNPDLCNQVGQQGDAAGQWIDYFCQMIYPMGADSPGQWDLWVEYAS